MKTNGKSEGLLVRKPDYMQGKHFMIPLACLGLVMYQFVYLQVHSSNIRMLKQTRDCFNTAPFTHYYVFVQRRGKFIRFCEIVQTTPLKNEGFEYAVRSGDFLKRFLRTLLISILVIPFVENLLKMQSFLDYA